MVWIYHCVFERVLLETYTFKPAVDTSMNELDLTPECHVELNLHREPVAS